MNNINSFGLILPKETVFASGSFAGLGQRLKRYERVLALCSRSAVRNGLFDSLTQQDGPEYILYEYGSGEPTAEAVDAAAAAAREGGCDAVMGLGGGSVMDTAKAAAAVAANGGYCEEYLEGVGTGRTLQYDPLPFIAVPTTSGTGAEATKNAVISNGKKHYKKSMRFDKMMASLVLIDPLLTLSLPKNTTASSGMDALTQLIESYTSIKANAFTKAICLEALGRADALIKAWNNGNDVAARENMSYCAFVSGVALANSGLGAAHGFASGLGAYTELSHGMACAILLPHVMRFNIEAAANIPAYAEVGRALLKAFGRVQPSDDLCAARAGEEIITGLCREMEIPSDLSFLNISQHTVSDIVSASMGGSMKGNPILMDVKTAEHFLRQLI